MLALKERGRPRRADRAR